MEKWFYNGTFMPDGTPVAVKAENNVIEEEYIKRGFRPVEGEVKKSRKRTARKNPGTKDR